MAAIKNTTPEAATIDTDAIPSHESDTMCRMVVKCVTRFFEDPANKADYERWKKERQQKGVHNAKN